MTKPRRGCSETISYARAHEVFRCVEGVLFNRIGRQGAAAGARSGSPDGSGYITVFIDGRRYKAHRLVWLMHFGSFPAGDIDHINGARDDNRIENLRMVEHVENMRNQKLRSTNTSGVVGVTWQKKHKNWRANITVNYVTVSLGTFGARADAEKARLNAEVLYGFHKNHGRISP